LLRYPFNSKNEFDMFEMIKNCKPKFPKDMDPDAVDLISKILVKDPKKRLGAGPKGSANDVAALKKHPFFSGIEFDKLYDMESPVRLSKTVFKVMNKEVAELLQPKPKIIKTGLVKKMKTLYYNRRQLILYNNGTLSYYDPKSNKKKGEIH
jgi:hypothetical protein